MKNKINIAELLKDCPKGMELDCTIYENVEFDYIEQNPESKYPIHCLMKTNGGYNALIFTHNGCYDRHPNAKCVIFPKGKTTWEEFVPPYQFKNGDIVSTTEGRFIFIFKDKLAKKESHYEGMVHFGLCIYDNKILNDKIAWNFSRPATEEEKAKLFQAIKDNGYKWNEETKTLEKIEPKFKVGDVIEDIYKKYLHCDSKSGKISQITDDKYIFTDGSYIHIQNQDNWGLVLDKFDITTLKPFDKVLVRNDKQKWTIDYFSFIDKEELYPFVCIGHYASQCIPYEGNEHLLGTTNDCDDFYKTWK